MSDPQPDKLKPRPPRAEPLQPDRVNSGDDQVPAPPGGSGDSGANADRPGESGAEGSAQRQKDQSDAARRNTSEGYGG